MLLAFFSTLLHCFFFSLHKISDNLSLHRVRITPESLLLTLFALPLGPSELTFLHDTGRDFFVESVNCVKYLHFLLNC